MEEELNEVAKEALDKVSGYMCVDSKGLVLSSSGIARPQDAAYLLSLAQLAGDLDPGNSPGLVLETDKTKILLQLRDSLLTVLYRDK